MEYTIAFKSGKSLEVQVNNGELLIQEISQGLAKSPSSPVQTYAVNGMMISLTELEFIAPSDIVGINSPLPIKAKQKR